MTLSKFVASQVRGVPCDWVRSRTRTCRICLSVVSEDVPWICESPAASPGATSGRASGRSGSDTHPSSLDCEARLATLQVSCGGLHLKLWL